MLRYFIAILLFLFCNFGTAQSKKSPKEIKRAAKNLLGYEDYNRALVELLKLYKQNKRDIQTNLNIGICYLNVNDDRSKAIPYFEFVLDNGEYKNEVLLYTGMAYAYHYEFDKAISYYNKYREKCTPEEVERRANSLLRANHWRSARTDNRLPAPAHAGSAGPLRAGLLPPAPAILHPQRRRQQHRSGELK